MKKALHECVAEISDAVEAFAWTDRRAYSDWLAQTYHYVRHSTRLLAAAAGRFPLTEAGDALHQRFVAHMQEERRHELLALHDLNALGSSLSDFPERPATRAFYEPQYYKIERQEPLALFGYILFLEVLSAERGPFIHREVQSTFGHTAATFLKLHTEDDPDHVHKAFKALEGATGEAQMLIEQNARQSAWCYRALLEDISRR